MGNQASLNPKQLEEMKGISNFSTEDVQKLFKRFKKLDKNHTGGLDLAKFQAIPNLENNPLVKRVVDTFDDDKNGVVDFEEFIRNLSIFASKTTQKTTEEKTKFAFRMYDVNNDGFISNGDLFKILKIMVGNNLTDVQLQQLVDRTILQGDKDKDGKLSYSEFVSMVKSTNIGEKLSVEV
uniref:Calcineurin B subunit n=1 Tax=Gymnochlora stellata TaxID=67809 RepID=B5A4M1_GYMST|nr:calcineurin B subunit [Gymnochlora stellata]